MDSKLHWENPALLAQFRGRLNGAAIRILCQELNMIFPFKEGYRGEWLDYKLSGGLSAAGYDVHVSNDYTDPIELPALRTVLIHTEEVFSVPNFVQFITANKSSIARRGIDASHCTVGEPGWRGCLTLEVRYVPLQHLAGEGQVAYLMPGQPIAQIIFDGLSGPTHGYSGSYQDQPSEAVSARKAEDG